MSLIIINDNKLFFQEKIPSFGNNESSAIFSDSCYGSFYFISIRPTGFLPAIFCTSKNYVEPIASTWSYTVGMYVDQLGMLYRLKLKSEDAGKTNKCWIRTQPDISIVDNSLRKDEFEVVAASPDVRDSAMAYMYMGFSPEETIAKIQMQYGYPEIKVTTKHIADIKKMLVEQTDKDIVGEFAWREIENMRKHYESLDNTSSKVEVDEGK